MSPPMKTTSSLKGWLIRKGHKKTQSFRYKNKNNINITNKKTVTEKIITQKHNSRCSNHIGTTTTSQLTLEGTLVEHEDLKEYGHPYSSSGSVANTFRIHSQNIQNIPIKTYKLKSHGIVKELKTKMTDVYW